MKRTGAGIKYPEKNFFGVSVMKQKKKMKKILIPAGLCLSALLLFGAFYFFGPRPAQTRVVSAGISVLSARATVAAGSGGGDAVCFDEAFFDRALGVSRVDAVTVTALPPVTAGRLLLGHGAVTLGQTIPRESFSYLTFEAAEGVEESSFSFLPTVGGAPAGYDLACLLTVTKAENAAPTLALAECSVYTCEKLCASGTLTANDPEGGRLFFEICRYPAHGTLTLSAGGNYVYTPNSGYTGEDSFTYRAQDTSGAYTPTGTVRVTVGALSAGYLYEDIADSTLHAAALTLAGRGVMSGEEVGGRHYFRPERTVDRAMFVTMLLSAAGVEAPDADNTGYADDAEIPAGMKGAIRYAKEKGWLGEGEKFRPRDLITREEAAGIAAAVLGLGAPTYRKLVTDFTDLSVGSVDAMYAAMEGGYIPAMADGSFSPTRILTRGDAALLLFRSLK